MKRALFAASTAGAAAMALEMMAIRWLAPAFGQTSATWSLLIAMTLGGGALGATAAATVMTRLTPAVGLLAAALSWLITAFTAPHLVEGLLRWPILSGTAVASAILVTPTCFALGAVLPLLAERTAARGARGLGGLAAASTAGSLVGTLLTALLLIPAWGLLASSLLWIGLLLIAALFTLSSSVPVQVVLAASVATATSFSITLARLLPASGIHSRYAWIESVHRDGALQLRVDGVLQGSFSGAAPIATTLLAHQQWSALLPYLHPRGRAALEIGLGSGELRDYLQTHHIEVDTVELDSVVIEQSKMRRRTHGTIYCADGRAFWRRSTKHYDFIVLDAFRGEVAPSHLLTVEAFREIAARMNPGGILVLHWIGSPTHASTAAIWNTLGAVYPERMALRSAPEDRLQDIFFFAAELPLSLPPHPDLLELENLSRAEFTPALTSRVLSDDLNPLETLQAELARQFRLLHRSPM